MSELTPNFGFKLPVQGVTPGWGDDLNSNFSKIDKILAAHQSKTLPFHIRPSGVAATETYWVLGVLGDSVSGFVVTPGPAATLAGGYGQGRLLLDVLAGGADLTGDITVAGTVRALGTGSQSALTEVMAVSGVGKYISQKTWRHTGTDNPLTLDATSVDLTTDAQLVSLFNNDNRRFTLRSISLWAEALASNDLTVEVEKVSVAGQAYSSVELTAGRLDLTPTTVLNPGTYHDSLVLNETVDSCSGEGLLMKVDLEDSSAWRSIRVHVEIDEEPVLAS